MSLLGLVWFSTGLFSSAGFALNRIYGVKNRSIVRQRLLGLVLPLPLIGAGYVAVGVNIAIRQWSVPGWLGPIAIWVALTWLIRFLYRLAPSRAFPRVDVLPGAGFAAIIIVGLAYAVPQFTRLTSHLNSGTRIITAVFSLVAWIWCIAQAVLIGAVINRIRLAREGQLDVLGPGGGY